MAPQGVVQAISSDLCRAFWVVAKIIRNIIVQDRKHQWLCRILRKPFRATPAEDFASLWRRLPAGDRNHLSNLSNRQSKQDKRARRSNQDKQAKHEHACQHAPQCFQRSSMRSQKCSVGAARRFQKSSIKCLLG